MNYLENMGENLELLDLVKKCNVTTYSLRSIRDKNTAIKNLKGLRVELLRVSPSYMRENPCELVKTEVLNHAEAVETINLLGEEDTLNLEEMILLGSFFSEHITYDPKLLADCVKAVGVAGLILSRNFWSSACSRNGSEKHMQNWICVWMKNSAVSARSFVLVP